MRGATGSPAPPSTATRNAGPLGQRSGTAVAAPTPRSLHRSFKFITRCRAPARLLRGARGTQLRWEAGDPGRGKHRLTGVREGDRCRAAPPPPEPGGHPPPPAPASGGPRAPPRSAAFAPRHHGCAGRGGQPRFPYARRRLAGTAASPALRSFRSRVLRCPRAAPPVAKRVSMSRL